MHDRARKLAVTLAVVAAVATATFWLSVSTDESELATFECRPTGVMNTDCHLVVVAPRGRQAAASRTLAAGEDVLRQVEALMSAHIETSEIAKVNRAAAEEAVSLSPRTLDVLRQARAYAWRTDGAFDVTCRPVLQLWKSAGAERRLPTAERIQQALDRTGWEHFRILPQGVEKLLDDAGIDLGGIAKKYAIDCAVEAMMDEGISGGMVDVGGDVRCFGPSPRGGQWSVAVRNPFGGQPLGTLSVGQGAVCTSGEYARFVEIDGRRYSHIVDPRTGQAATGAISVTVVGPDAVSAGVWATALCVLGPDGLQLLPPDASLDAMVVAGTKDAPRFYYAGTFREMLRDGAPAQSASAPTTAPASQP